MISCDVSSEVDIDLEEGALLLHVGEQVDEPLEGLLVAVDPVELYTANAGSRVMIEWE